jgi:hypothetical protein
MTVAERASRPLDKAIQSAKGHNEWIEYIKKSGMSAANKAEFISNQQALKERTLNRGLRRAIDVGKQIGKLGSAIEMADNPLLSRESANKAMDAASREMESPAIRKARVKPIRRGGI